MDQATLRPVGWRRPHHRSRTAGGAGRRTMTRRPSMLMRR